MRRIASPANLLLVAALISETRSVAAADDGDPVQTLASACALDLPDHTLMELAGRLFNEPIARERVAELADAGCSGDVVRVAAHRITPSGESRKAPATVSTIPSGAPVTAAPEVVKAIAPPPPADAAAEPRRRVFASQATRRVSGAWEYNAGELGYAADTSGLSETKLTMLSVICADNYQLTIVVGNLVVVSMAAEAEAEGRLFRSVVMGSYDGIDWQVLAGAPGSSTLPKSHIKRLITEDVFLVRWSFPEYSVMEEFSLDGAAAAITPVVEACRPPL